MSQAEIERGLRDVLRSLEIGETGDTYVPRSVVLGYNLLPPDAFSDPEAKKVVYRMNSLMDLYFFATTVLGKNRFSKNPDKRRNLHYQMCLTVMKDGLKEGIEIPRDHYKDCKLDTIVPTPYGYKTIGEITVGDIVYAGDGSQTEVIGVSEIFESNKCYELTFSTGEKITAGAGHQWFVDERRARANSGMKSAPRIKTTEQLAKDFIYTQRQYDDGKIYPEYNYRVPNAGPLKNASLDYCIHPYILGVWLGDGSSANTELTSEDDEIPTIIRSFGVAVDKLKSGQRYAIRIAIENLRAIGVLNNKHIPTELLRASQQERQWLLQGLMDTDGSVSKEGQCSFTSCNKILIEEVHELAASLGYKVNSIGNYLTSCNGKENIPFQMFTFYATKDRSPFLLSRKIARLKNKQKTSDQRSIINVQEVPSVKTKCISVDFRGRSFLVTKSFIPTHNSTVYSENFPIWRALPFGHKEEDLFSNAGYSDLYIEWMRRTHSQDVRVLLVSETIKNAIKLGTRIGNHYENNVFLRHLFPEIMPTEKEIWTNESLHQRRTPAGRGQGEGTFDFIGVGAALQSRHYDVVVQDDLVGREARKSSIVMADTIDYHQILVGATDSDPDNPGRDFDEIVVGNRWSHDDLNSHIRAEEHYFSWTTHSALGGCCSLHPFGEPIFPEAFTREKLLRWKSRLGSYHFSCQFLNFPIDPTKQKFNLADLRYFHFEKVTGALAIPKESPIINRLFESSQPQQYRIAVRHHVADGDVEKDIFPRNLDRYMIVDPNHGGSHLGAEAGKNGRCRHAIAITGVSRDPRRIYLLDQWAKACPIDEFVTRIFFLAVKWKLRTIYVEAVAAQKYLLYHLNYFIEQNKHTRPELVGIRIEPLKTPQNANAKGERIENFIPIVERHELWLDVNNCTETKEEMEQLGQRKGLIDLLDVLSYGPQVWKFDTVSDEKIEQFMEKQMAQHRRRMASAVA